MKQTEVETGGPCWVELSTSDPEAAKWFYAELFGWRVETDPRPEAGGYSSLLLGEAPVAGLAPAYPPGRPTSWTVSFAVADADAVAELARARGGSVVMEPMEVFDLGRFAILADPAGAVFSVWQARAFGGAAVLNEAGSLGWVELATRDTAGAKEFYTRVFGWSVTLGGSYTQWGLAGQDFGGMLEMGEQYPPEVPPHWMPYFAVADVDLTAERAAGLGAEVVLAPVQMDGGPRLAVLRDAQGGVFGIHAATGE
ncbi:hydroxylase [Kitasatospora sp. MMS16-BH015]|uniref:VOC family protein n=1 Tax=Kitasatospora sp. MMS16-BH015 TaxID=2018025 RepID=UPI000CA3A407|nr:VOC family protein [Kitasatospora sp. MMS16-BH015]AUG81128.1 hydroxylase [Kitasatospora sp. MMS16-BH015]